MMAGQLQQQVRRHSVFTAVFALEARVLLANKLFHQAVQLYPKCQVIPRRTHHGSPHLHRSAQFAELVDVRLAIGLREIRRFYQDRANLIV